MHGSQERKSNHKEDVMDTNKMQERIDAFEKNVKQNIDRDGDDRNQAHGTHRRTFLKTAIVAVAGVAATVPAALAAPAEQLPNKKGGNIRTQNTPQYEGKPNFQPLEVNSPMAKWKKPQSVEFVRSANARFSFSNWQSGNDDSVYYNLNLPGFFKSKIVMPPDEFCVLKRAIRPDLLDVTFKAHDGKTTPTLKQYLTGPKQVQAMLMAHKGKVVFETYPGMNPTDIHTWMSTGKTTAGLLPVMLWEDGKLDFDKPITTYVPFLKGSAWDGVTVKNAMNMASGLDIEETFSNLVNPDTWIARFFTQIFEGKGDEWQQMLKEAKPIAGERPGDLFRYSSAITEILILVVENITGMPWQEYWGQRVWSKIGPRNPFIVCLTPDLVPLGAGLVNSMAEDMLRYALLYTPSWRVVAKEQVISDKVLKCIQTLGDPRAYPKSEEAEMGTKWFGETPERNTAQWDHAFPDGAMFKHGNMGQGIYVDPARDFCGMYFGLASNIESVSGIDHSPGYLRAAAKVLAGG